MSKQVASPLKKAFREAAMYAVPVAVAGLIVGALAGDFGPAALLTTVVASTAGVVSYRYEKEKAAARHERTRDSEGPGW